jgi:TrmH family RNA methyltransferase
MLDKNKIKLFNSLKIKKYRELNSLFIAEREKPVFDLINSGAKLKYLLVCEDYFLPGINNISAEVIICKSSELKKITSLKTEPDIIGVFETYDKKFNEKDILNNLSIFCDDIQNPGNFGTIIRTADWFGIRNIFCSTNTVDLYNPKVVQATAGSLFRINIIYIDKNIFFEDILKLKIPVYGTFLEGENIYETELSKNGIIVLGNEGQGISSLSEKYVTKKIYIPGFPEINPETESLNVSIAAAITFSEFRRRK